MATNATTPTTSEAQKAEPVKAPVAETAKTEAAAPKTEQLVTKIVTVESEPVSKGVDKMTKTAEKTAKKTKNFTADLKDRAGDVLEKGKKLAADGFEFQKANVEAVIEAGKIAAKGAQEIGKTNVEFAKANFEDVQVAVKELTSVKTPTDFVKLQGDFARKGFDTAVSQTTKNTEAMVKLVTDAFQPISNRMAATTDLFKKAA
jgi:phasin family protein